MMIVFLDLNEAFLLVVCKEFFEYESSESLNSSIVSPVPEASRPLLLTLIYLYRMYPKIKVVIWKSTGMPSPKAAMIGSNRYMNYCIHKAVYWFNGVPR